MTETDGFSHLRGLPAPYGPVVRGPRDWTVNPRTGRSNSSREYLRLVADVEQIILDSARALIAGQTESVARSIVSSLAHKHGMRLCDD